MIREGQELVLCLDLRIAVVLSENIAIAKDPNGYGYEIVFDADGEIKSLSAYPKCPQIGDGLRGVATA